MRADEGDPDICPCSFRSYLERIVKIGNKAIVLSKKAGYTIIKIVIVFLTGSSIKIGGSE